MVSAITRFIGKLNYFYINDGASVAGRCYHAARKAGNPITIKQAFADSYTQHLAEIAKKASGNVPKVSFFKGLCKGLGKIAAPAMLIVPELINAYKELKNGGGIGGALKSLAKGAINALAYPIAGFAVAAFGATGGWAFVLTLVGSFIVGQGTSLLANSILGKTKTELLAEQGKEEGQGGVNNPSLLNGKNGTVDLAKIDAQIRSIDNYMRGLDLNSNSCVQSYNGQNTTSSGRRVFVC